MGSTEGNLARDISAIFPKELLDLNPAQQKVSVTLYRLLAKGRPVSCSDLAMASGETMSRVEDILKSWPAVYYDNHGRVIGYWGLAIPKMKHVFEVNGHTLYTWCAWDGLFIPWILQAEARITSTCAESGTEIRLEVGTDGVRKVFPSTTVMSFLIPEAAAFQKDRDVITNFCHFIFFFRSREDASAWVSDRPGTIILSLEEAFQIGRLKNKTQYKVRPVAQAPLTTDP